MIELMQLLYNYTLETEFRTQLHTDSYRIKKLNTDQLDRQLHHTLPENLPAPSGELLGRPQQPAKHRAGGHVPGRPVPDPQTRLILLCGFLRLDGGLLFRCGLGRGLRGGFGRRFRCRFRRSFLGRRLFRGGFLDGGFFTLLVGPLRRFVCLRRLSGGLCRGLLRITALVLRQEVGTLRVDAEGQMCIRDSHNTDTPAV